MNLGPVTKIDKKNKISSKKSEDDVMSANCDVIVILVSKFTFSFITAFYLIKTETRTKKSLTQLSHLYCFG